MGSNVKRIIILLILFMFVSVGGIVLYANLTFYETGRISDI